MNIKKIQAFVEQTVGEGYRLNHILSTVRECDRLATLFSLSEDEAQDLHIAALLHDLTKGHKQSEHRVLYEQFGIPFGEVEAHSPKTLHAVTGAYLARQTFPEAVNDRVFGCILRHTTAAPAMTLPEKLLYLADYIEEERTFPSCVALRQVFYTIPEDGSLEAHLNHILLLSLNQTLAELVDENAYIHPTTIEARNYLLVHP